MMIRITEDVWDDGADHHPATLLARKGEVLNVLETFVHGYEVARNGRFFVSESECEVVASSPTTVTTSATPVTTEKT